METNRKKQLLEEYKNRHPEKGVISFHCKATGETFLGISKDTRADLNSNRFKMSAGGHPNKRMQELWNQYGENSFEVTVPKILKYEDPTENHTGKLQELYEQCLAAYPEAKKIWR